MDDKPKKTSSRDDPGVPDGIIAQAAAVVAGSNENDQSRASRSEGAGTSGHGAQTQRTQTQLVINDSAKQHVLRVLRRMRSDSLNISLGDGLSDSIPPPPYDGTFNSVDLSQDGLDTKASVSSMNLNNESILC